MKRTIIFEAEVKLGDKKVDFRIYKVEGDDVITHYEFDFNPQVRDIKQNGFHVGESMMGTTLDELLFRFQNYKKEFTHIVEERNNSNF